MVDWTSFLQGGVATLVLIILIGMVLLGLLLGKVKEQIKWLLTKLYSRTSLMLIAIIDVIAAFDPTQTFLGLGLAPVTAILVFGSEWGLHDKFKKERIGPSIVEAIIAAFIVLIPLPIAGIFTAWFGVMGDKKKSM